MLGFSGIYVQNLKHSFCPMKVNVMGKGKNWGFLQKFEIEMLNYSISHILGMTHQFEHVIIPSFMGLLT